MKTQLYHHFNALLNKHSFCVEQFGKGELTHSLTFYHLALYLQARQYDAEGIDFSESKINMLPIGLIHETKPKKIAEKVGELVVAIITNRPTKEIEREKIKAQMAEVKKQIKEYEAKLEHKVDEEAFRELQFRLHRYNSLEQKLKNTIDERED